MNIAAGNREGANRNAAAGGLHRTRVRAAEGQHLSLSRERPRFSAKATKQVTNAGRGWKCCALSMTLTAAPSPKLHRRLRRPRACRPIGRHVQRNAHVRLHGCRTAVFAPRQPTSSCVENTAITVFLHCGQVLAASPAALRRRCGRPWQGAATRCSPKPEAVRSAHTQPRRPSCTMERASASSSAPMSMNRCFMARLSPGLQGLAAPLRPARRCQTPT